MKTALKILCTSQRYDAIYKAMLGHPCIPFICCTCFNFICCRLCTSLLKKYYLNNTETTVAFNCNLNKLKLDL